MQNITLSENFLLEIINDRSNFFSKLFNDKKEHIIYSAISISNAIERTHKSRGKIIIFGNGGSNAQASHFATELIVRFKGESKRPPIAAISISSDPSVITAAGNDFSFDEIFARQLNSLLNENDCVIAFSTSGKSPNVINGIYEASKIINNENIFLITGNDIKNEQELICNVVQTPIKGSTETYQEYHLILIHLVCNLLENIS